MEIVSFHPKIYIYIILTDSSANNSTTIYSFFGLIIKHTSFNDVSTFWPKIASFLRHQPQARAKIHSRLGLILQIGYLATTQYLTPGTLTSIVHCLDVPLTEIVGSVTLVPPPILTDVETSS